MNKKFKLYYLVNFSKIAYLSTYLSHSCIIANISTCQLRIRFANLFTFIPTDLYTDLFKDALTPEACSKS